MKDDSYVCLSLSKYEAMRDGIEDMTNWKKNLEEALHRVHGMTPLELFREAEKMKYNERQEEIRKSMHRREFGW
jgi:hypothetical protein